MAKAIRAVGVLAMAALCAAGAMPGHADEPVASTKRVMVFGGYQSAFDNHCDMVAALLEHGNYGADVEVVHNGMNDAHATAAQLLTLGAFDYLLGKGSVERQNPDVRRVLGPYARGEMDAAVLEINKPYVPDAFERDLPAARVFAENARARGIRAVLFLMPDDLQCPTAQGATAEERLAGYRKRHDLVEAHYTRILREVRIPAAPTHRVFLLLRERHPDMDLHAPRGAGDTHLSPRDHYVTACSIAAALHPVRPPAPPDPATIMDAYVRARERLNAGYSKSGEPQRMIPESPAITDSENRAIHGAVWDAQSEYEARWKAYWDRIPAIEFTVAPQAIASGATARVTWRVAGVDQVMIEPGLGAVPGTGTRDVAFPQSVTLALRVPGVGEPHPNWTREVGVYPWLEPAVTVASDTRPGLSVAYRESSKPADGAPLGTETLPNVDCNWGDGPVGVSGKPDGVDALFTGFLRVETAGVYAFRGVADDVIEVEIGGQSAFQTAHGNERKGRLALRAGMHVFRARFREHGGGAYVKLWWQPPAGDGTPSEETIVPAGAFCHAPEPGARR
jgi:hypothetical protein